MSMHNGEYRSNLINLIVGLILPLIGSFSAYSQHILLSENFDYANGNVPPSGWEFQLLNGNSQFDSFFFHSNQFIPAGPIDRKCASFDVYNGGFPGRSNGDGYTEDAVLVSSQFSFDSSKIEVEFDHLFTRLRSPKVFVEISFNRSINWRTVWGDSLGNTKPEHIRFTVDQIPDTARSARLRFRWRTDNTLNTQGFWLFDNVRVIERFSRDIAVTSGNKGLLDVCHAGDQRIIIDVKNVGLDSYSNIVVHTEVKNDQGAYQAPERDTISILRSGEAHSIQLTLDSMYVAGQYYVMSTLITSDDWRSNDSCKISFRVNENVADANISDVSRCGPGDLTFKGKSDDDLLWLNPNDASTSVGSTFTTPFLHRTDTFSVEQIVRMKTEVHTGQGPYRFNGASSGGSYVRIVAKRDLILEKILQHFASANKSFVRVYAGKGDYKGIERDPNRWQLIYADSVDTHGWGSLTSVDIEDQVVSQGDTLSLYINCIGSSIYTFKQGVFEWEDRSILLTSDAINNTAFSAGGPLYSPFSWDGSLKYSVICKSEPREIVANVVDRPIWRGFQKHHTYFGLMNDGTESDPDQLSEKGKAVYEIPAPHYKLRSGYGTTWKAQLSSIRSSSGQTLSDSFYWIIDPTTNADLQVGFAPLGQWIDSTVIVTMVITDLQTECDTMVQRVVHVSRTPIPAFDWTGECADAHVQFTNLTPKRDSATFYWDFADGTTSADQDPVHKFRRAGTYPVELTATNKFGISGSLVDTVTVSEKPELDARVIHACLGTDIQIILPANNTPNAEYALFFGGSQVAASIGSDTFLMNFPMEGKYQLELKAKNEGCPDSTSYQAYQFPVPEADFVAHGECAFDTISFENLSMISGGAKLGYRWHKNGVLFETRKAPILKSESAGNMAITLQSVSEFGCTDTITKELTIQASPIAHFNASLACNNEATTFNNTSDLPEGLKYQYSWNFGDGSYSADSSPVNKYDGVGERRVSLTITANNGCNSRYDTSLIVRVQPNARFHVSDICSGDEAVFVNFSKVENKILNYSWRFGDGQRSTIHSPRHIYSNDETSSYRVILEVYTDDNSCRDEFDTTITVHRRPSCAFDYRSTGDPLEIILSAEDEEIEEYTWSFEGGGVSLDPEPVHRFQVPGTYSIQLFARTAASCECTLTKDIAVGLLHSKSNELSVDIYPNPTTETIYYNLQGHSSAISMKITDASGRLIRSESGLTNQGQINVIDLSSGLYLLTLSSNSREMHWKFRKK